MLNEITSKVLRSPCCKAKLKKSEAILICVKCKKKYGFIKEKPVLIKREKEKFFKELLNFGKKSRYSFEQNSVLKKLIPPASAIRVVNKEKSLISKLSKKDLVLIIGYDEEKFGGERGIYMDINPDLDIDVVADTHTLPFANASFSLVICRFVFEHIQDPDLVISEIYRVLKKGGIAYVDAPFLEPFHPSPSDYYRFSLPGLKTKMARFKEIESGISIGPAGALTWILQDFPGIFFDSKFMYRFMKFVTGWFVFPIKYLDKFLVKRKYAYTLSSGFYFIGKK